MRGEMWLSDAEVREACYEYVKSRMDKDGKLTKRVLVYDTTDDAHTEIGSVKAIVILYENDH